jgi:hypothetical protein
MSEKLRMFAAAAGRLAEHLDSSRPVDTASVTAGEGAQANVEGTPAPKAPLSKREAAKIKVPKGINLGAAGSLINEDFSDIKLDDAADAGPGKKEPYKSPAELSTERMVDKTNPFGVKMPPATKRTKRSRTGGSFSNTEGLVDASSEELRTKTSNDTLRHIAEHLSSGSCSRGNCVHSTAPKSPASMAWAFPTEDKATPKGRRTSAGKLIAEGKGEGAAQDSWRAAKDLHTILTRHFDTLPEQLGAKADELEARVTSAKRIAAQSDGLTDADRASMDRSVANVSEKSKWLREQGTTDSLREHLATKNRLVNIGAALDAVKTEDGKFKDAEDPRRLHGLIQDSLAGLNGVHNFFQRSAVAPYGVGSPVSDGDVKHAVRVSQKLETKAAPISATELPRDAHPLAEKDLDGNIKDPNAKLGLAPAGHVWGVGLTPDLNGNLRTVEANRNTLELVTKTLGKNHPTTNRIKKLVDAQEAGKQVTGAWFNADGTKHGKKSYTSVAKESLQDPETLAKAETQRMRSITTKTTGGSTGFAVTKPVPGVDYVSALTSEGEYVPPKKEDETLDVSDKDAPPGHMWTTDNKKTILVNKEQLDRLTVMKGADHPDTVKMDRLYRAANKLPTREEEQASAEKRGINYEKSLGKSGKTVVEGRLGRQVVKSEGALEGQATQAESRTAVFERTVPGAQDSLVDEAVGHITAGRRVPKDLRRTIGAAGIAKAIQKAGVTREPNGRS